MFISQVFLTYFFRLFNFGIVISLAVYLFKKNAVPALSHLMAKKEAEKDSLLLAQSLLEDKQAELEKAIQADNALCESFKIKISEWKKSLHKEQLAKENDMLVRFHAIQERRIKKNDLHKQAITQKMVSEEVVKRLHDSLDNYFYDESQAAQYIESLITSIDEKIL